MPMTPRPHSAASRGLKSDPWQGYEKGARISKQTLAAALKASEP